jgi:hypothetical protein
MARSNYIDHAEVMLAHEIVQVRIYKDESWTCSPMAKKSWFNVFEC